MGDAADDRDGLQRVVDNHARWVFAAVRRRVRDPELAEDVTQAVFLLYWRKGMAIESEGKRAGWLYRAARYCSANAMRLKQVRQRHEREAAMQKQRIGEQTAGWTEVEGELEPAMDRLSDRDRQAVVLRFYRGLSLVEVSRSLGISESAAQKRVERAVQKLRALLTRNNLEVRGSTLSSLILTHATQSAPSGLGDKMTAAITNGPGTSTAGGIATGAAKTMVIAKAKVVATAVAVLIGCLTAVVWQSSLGGQAKIPADAIEIKLPPARAGEVVELLSGPPTLKEIIAAVRAQEDAVQNLRVEGFDTMFFRRKLDADNWERSPEESHGDAWYARPPGGKMRLAFSSWIAPWAETAVERPGAIQRYLDQQLDVGFDGEISVEVRHASGVVGEAKRPSRLAMIHPQRHLILDQPNSLYATTVAGLAWAHKRGFDGKRFSEGWEGAIANGKPPTVTRERADGVELVRLTYGTGASIWLDPQKSYAFTRMHSEFRSGVRLIAYRHEAVTEYVEAAPGLWLPLAGFIEDLDFDPPGGLLRIEYRARRVVANDPAFDEAVLRPTIPDGYEVTDTRIHPAYRSSQQDEAFSKGELGNLDQEKLARAKQMKQVIGLCSLYVQDHRRQWPTNLEEAHRYLRVDGDQLDKWVYHRPTSWNTDVPVLFEKEPAFTDGELVVFQDGFVEFVQDQARLAKLRDEGGASQH